MSGAVAGLAAHLGTPGLGITSALVMLIGNPFPGAASAPRMLPEPGRGDRPVAAARRGKTLLRSVSCFDGAAATGPALTPAGWAALGLGAVLLGGAMKIRPAQEKKDEPVADREPALAG